MSHGQTLSEKRVLAIVDHKHRVEQLERQRHQRERCAAVHDAMRRGARRCWEWFKFVSACACIVGGAWVLWAVQRGVTL